MMHINNKEKTRKYKKSKKKIRKTRSKTQRGGGENEQKLLDAMWTGNLTNVKDALAAGADVNVRDNDKDGNTALILACIAGMPKTDRLNIVSTLIENHAKVDVENNYGITALMYVCQYGDIAVMEELIYNIEPALKRANYVNAKDEDGDNVITTVDEFISEDTELLKDVLRVLINAGLTGSRPGLTIADELINEYEYPRELVQPLIDARDTSMTRRIGRTSSSVFNKLPHHTRTMGGRKTKKRRKTRKNRRK